MDSHSANIAFALVAIATFAWAFILIWLGAKPAPIAPRSIASRKHVRTTYLTGSVKLTYYGENGRKVTSRQYAARDVLKARTMARAKGYRVI